MLDALRPLFFSQMLRERASYGPTRATFVLKLHSLPPSPAGSPYLEHVLSEFTRSWKYAFSTRGGAEQQAA